MSVAGCVGFEPGGGPAPDAGPLAESADAASDGEELLWFSEQFPARRRIQIDNRGREALAGFPVPVRGALLPGDIRFVADDHATELAHEIEGATTSETTSWVRVDLPADDLVAIWVYYEGAGQPDTSNSAVVFEDYGGVYHLSDSFGIGDPIDDSASGGHDLAGIDNIDLSDQIAGAIGRALEFGANPNAIATTLVPEAGLNAGSFQAKTFEAWFRTSSFDRMRLFTNGVTSVGLDLSRPEVEDGGVTLSGGSLTFDDWHHLAVVVDRGAGTGRLYVNGVLEDSQFISSTSSPPNSFVVGQSISGALNYDGDIDEIRVGPARPADWFEATYAMVAGAAISIDAEERLP